MKRREFITLLAGTAAAWPLTAEAQQPAKKIPRIGVLWHAGSAEEEAPYLRALLEGFKGLGYVDGRNITIEHRFPNEMPERFKSMAAELVSLNVDVLVSVGNNASPYAKNATKKIPVVFIIVTDPVESNLVDSFARPSGNVTGLSSSTAELIGKRLQILKETIPGLQRVAQLVNPNAPHSRRHIEMTRTAAAELGFTIQTFQARALDELEPAFDAMARAGMQAVTVNPEGLAFQGRAVIAKLARARRLALCTYSRETFEPGAFMSYGTDQVAICRRTAVYVDKILKGAKPSDLPVEQPTKFEYLINLKTAKAIGLTVPPILLSRADEVVERGGRKPFLVDGAANQQFNRLRCFLQWHIAEPLPAMSPGRLWFQSGLRQAVLKHFTSSRRARISNKARAPCDRAGRAAASARRCGRLGRPWNNCPWRIFRRRSPDRET
jgi:putative ABC transport system substrate-binding protein